MTNEAIPTFEMRLMAFLSQFQEDCRMCLKTHMCSQCRAAAAKSLMVDLKLRSKPVVEIDNSIGARCRRVLECLQKSKQPVSSRDIILPGCPYSLKEFTLNHMLNTGMIRRRKVLRPRGASYFYEYFLPSGKSHKKG